MLATDTNQQGTSPARGDHLSWVVTAFAHQSKGPFLSGRERERSVRTHTHTHTHQLHNDLFHELSKGRPLSSLGLQKEFRNEFIYKL